MDFTLTLTGTRPLLMHHSRLSNPIDPYAQSMKQIHSKRKKTDDDYRELARREWIGAVYHTGTLPTKGLRDELSGIGAYVPGENIERMLVDSAKITRNGMDVKRGVMISTDFNKPIYSGPSDIESLCTDENFRLLASVKVGVQRVMRCRPKFEDWQVSASGYLDEAILNPEEFQTIAERAGKLIGLGDWRPRYGRFTARVAFE